MKVKIRIIGIKDLIDFVKVASLIKGNVFITKGTSVIDGKNFPALVNIDISTGAEVEYPNEEKDFEKFLKPFIIK